MRRLLQRSGFTPVNCVYSHPIQSVSGNKSRFLRGVKNVWFEVFHALAMVSFGYLNLDNLFVVATKESQTKAAKV
jgi:hypothetical protein